MPTAKHFTKDQVVEKICNPKTNIQKIKDIVDVDNYVEVKSSFPTSAKVIYGVNVRLKSGDDILPFITTSGTIDSAGKETFNAEAVAKRVKKYIPSFNNDFNISEIYFKCEVDAMAPGATSGRKIKATNILAYQKGFGSPKTTATNSTIESWLNDPNSFLLENIDELQFPAGTTVFVWITGEDYDPSNSGQSFLSNTLAISDSDAAITNIRSKHSEIVYFLFLLKSRYLAEIDLRRKTAAEKSAKAAIMSRNMSHNLGSHVMAYLKQKLGSVAAIMSKENKVLYDLYDGERFKINSLTLTEDQKNQVEMPFLVGLGRFIGYLQERQDYIATIATDYIPYGAPVNMKDAIYDELNPDLRYMRHHDGGNNRPLNILLSYIAKSEGLSRENMGRNPQMEADLAAAGDNVEERKRIEAEYEAKKRDIDQFDSYNDILFGYKTYRKEHFANTERIIEHTFGLEPEFCDSMDESLTEMRKVNFSLPGGLVGRQAVFSIIENIIRNAAKHGDTSSVKNLCFTFDVIDCEKLKDNDPKDGGIIELDKRICDPIWRALYANADDGNNLFLLSITDNLKYDNSIVNALLPGLIQPYIDGDGVMTTANKGIKEIRISSAWLRGDTNEDNYYHYGDTVDAPKHAPLVAVEVTSEGCLRYIIALKKNRLVAYIKEGMPKQDLAVFDSLNAKYPNDWVGFNTVKDALKESKSSYRYILVANDEIYESLRPSISNRVRVWNPSSKQRAHINSSLVGTNGESIPTENKVLSVIYQIFTGIDEDDEPVYIWDGKAEECHKGEYIYPKIRVFSAEKEADLAKYVYRTHHAAEKEFRNYWNDKLSLYNGIIAIDAVTGDNSSDRLVRREPLNEEWYYGHLNALKKRVAIFDERLFKIVHNVDEAKFFASGNKFAVEVLDGLKNGQITIDDAVQKIEDYGFLTSDDFESLLDCSTVDEVISLLAPYAVTPEFQEQEVTGNFLSAVYAEKRVDVYTIIKDKAHSDSFVIVGCTDYSSSDTSLYRAIFQRVGTLRASNDGGFQVILDISESRFQDCYDYISIHQGILDKIYEGLGIKVHNEANDVCKKQVTALIHNRFMADKRVIAEYLPCFIIHSGRAKPTKDDMPQKQPFVQYAAIENGVKDCKYSLIELLDYARYESSDGDIDAEGIDIDE